MTLVIASLIAPLAVAVASGGALVAWLQRRRTKADTADKLVEVAWEQVSNIREEIARAQARAAGAERATEAAETEVLRLRQQMRRIQLAAIAAGIDLPLEGTGRDGTL